MYDQKATMEQFHEYMKQPLSVIKMIRFEEWRTLPKTEECPKEPLQTTENAE